MHMNATKWVVSKLKKNLGLETDKELLKALHIDVYDTRGIDLHTGTVPDYTGPKNNFFPSDWGGDIFSFWGIKEFDNKTSSGWTIDIEPPPLSSAKSIEEFEKYQWPSIDWFDFSNFRSKLEKWTDFSIMATGASVFQHPTYLRGMDVLMLDMALNPKIAHYFFKKFTDFYYAYYSRMFEAAGNLIDVFALADDFGAQDALLISPSMFDEFVVPYLRRMINLAHEHDIFFLLHTDGDIEKIIPKLIEIGVDILDPIQPESMDPLKVKEKWGDKLCLRGAIGVQQILSRSSTEAVVRETKRIIDHLAPGGGYILAPGHPVLQDDIPVENIIAMYKTGYEYGIYK